MGVAQRRLAAKSGSAARGREKARILLVDDDERNLLALSEVLESLAEVVTATSGREALRQLLQGDFAVILLDVFMPGMDGYETAHLIRSREQTARIPIIFLSAVNKETEHLMRGYAMGAVDYVFKPVDPIILQSKVSVFVDLFDMRMQVEAQGQAEQELREANFRAELEKLQIERELQASQLRQAAIMDALPMALYEGALGDNGTMVRRFVGGDLVKLTGLAAEALEGSEEDWERRIHPEDAERVLQADRSERSESLAIEYRWLGPDDEVRHFLDQCVPIAGEGGLRWAGTLLDVTRQKQLEARLLQSGKMDAIGQLTGGVAHDFNNLLAAVLGGIHVLQRRVEFGDREQVVLDQMRHAAEQGAELVRRMMAFARKQELTPTSVDPARLCETVAGLVEHTMGGTVQVEWNCPGTSQDLFVDQSQLELALVNLILNARDAMPRGGLVTVDIEDAGEHAVADLPPGSYLRICVADVGEGIAPSMLDKITEPFFTTKEAGKGTGLGLSMVVGFVQQSGGRFSIASSQGEGTKVEILLPARPRQDAKVSSPTQAGNTAIGVTSVLLVDDDDAVRTVVAEQLRDLGLKVESVADGASAIARLKAGGDSFDLLLTDFAMPGMNGIETILSALKLHPGLRTLLMTGYADDEVLAEHRDSIAVLRKPVRMDELERVLA